MSASAAADGLPACFSPRRQTPSPDRNTYIVGFHTTAAWSAKNVEMVGSNVPSMVYRSGRRNCPTYCRKKYPVRVEVSSELSTISDSLPYPAA
jgi:hypothetical protein